MKRLLRKLKSRFKRKPRTGQGNFRSYRRSNAPRRRAARVPKQVKKAQKEARKTRRSQAKWQKVWQRTKIVLGLVAALALAYWAFLTPSFEIREIQVEGELDTEVEQAAVREHLQDELGKNLLFFNPNEAEEAMEEAYPHLKRVVITRQFFHAVRARLESHEDRANIHVKNEDGSMEFYIINELGYVSSQGNSEELPTLVMNISGTEPVDTQEILIPAETLENLLSARELFEAKFGMKILEVHYVKRAREVHLYTERDFMVWMDLQQDIDLQLAKLKKALSEVDIYGTPLDYIDLRISGQQGEKVIYKAST